ncbi:hypothetical protein M0805_009652 [Coniferiporia weirii]|nr:hypothetical protein M0805_009652 [Coniferiporia weirii]
MPTPGILFLLRVLPVILLPDVGLYTFLYALDEAFGVSLPPWLRWAALIAVGPFVLSLKVLQDGRTQTREAARRGAIRVPVIPGKWPGNIDVLLNLVKAFETGYIAEPFWPVVEKLGKVFGTRILWVGGIFTIEPEHIKQVLVTEFSNFEKGSEFMYAAHSVLGVGVFNSDGEMWKFHRSMTRPFFSRERISDFELFARHADAAVACAKRRLREGYALDAQDLAARFTLDSATEFLFGRCVHALLAGLPYPNNEQHANTTLVPEGRGSTEEFANAFAQAQVVVIERAQKAMVWPQWEIWRDKSREPMEVVRAYLDPILDEAIRNNREKKASPVPNNTEEGETLLDQLVKLTDDPVILKDETLNIMIAGRDTTAATLTFVVYMLALHPEVVQCLRAEILERVGPTRKPTYDDIREMKYLRAVINETLRLYPPVPFDTRKSINATTLANLNPQGKPWYVPPRTGVAYSVFMMHRRTDLWGPDAHNFDPNRFLDERLHKYLVPNPFIFLPFNAGPRICLGQQFAYNEASFMLVRLLQTFDAFELDSSAQPADSLPPSEWKDSPGRQSVERIFLKTHLTLYAFKGLWVRMRETENRQG